MQRPIKHYCIHWRLIFPLRICGFLTACSLFLCDQEASYHWVAESVHVFVHILVASETADWCFEAVFCLEGVAIGQGSNWVGMGQDWIGTRFLSCRMGPDLDPTMILCVLDPTMIWHQLKIEDPNPDPRQSGTEGLKFYFILFFLTWTETQNTGILWFPWRRLISLTSWTIGPGIFFKEFICCNCSGCGSSGQNMKGCSDLAKKKKRNRWNMQERRA